MLNELIIAFRHLLGDFGECSVLSQMLSESKWKLMIHCLNKLDLLGRIKVKAIQSEQTAATYFNRNRKTFLHFCGLDDMFLSMFRMIPWGSFLSWSVAVIEWPCLKQNYVDSTGKEQVLDMKRASTSQIPEVRGYFYFPQYERWKRKRKTMTI